MRILSRIGGFPTEIRNPRNTSLQSYRHINLPDVAYFRFRFSCNEYLEA
jgi:hypothetical protein